MVEYNTVVLGASKINNARSIVVFNTRSFNNYSGLIKLGDLLLKDNPEVLSELSKVPTRKNIYSVVRNLLKLKDLSGNNLYSYIDKLDIPDRIEFTWDISDNSANLVSSDGFDIIVFISEPGNILGFTVLSKPQGDHINNRDESTFSIRRSYLTYRTRIIVGFGNKVVINGNTIKLLDSLVNEAKFDKKSLVGDKLYDYTDVDVILSSGTRDTSYTSDLSRIANNSRSKYVYTDACTSIIQGLGIVNSVKLDLIREGVPVKNIYLYDRFQVGYLEGEIVMYMWSTQYNNFVVMSLRNLSSGGKAIYYIGDGSSIDTKYNIVGFSNRYLVAELDGKRYFYNILRSQWLDFGSNHCLTDFADPNSKFYITKVNQFSNPREAVSDYDFLRDIHINLERVSERGSIKVVRKDGAWVTLRLDDIDGYVISNFSTSMFIDKSELLSIMYLNNDCLILRDKNGIKLVDNVGYHKTDKLVNSLTARNSSNILDYYSKEWSPTSSYSPFRYGEPINKSFLNLFRKNRLPESNKFVLISALSGLIYYSTGNGVNFL